MKLPQELVELVIDNCHNGVVQHTECECSLVHRSWIHRCRAHCFNHVSFYQGHGLSEWASCFSSQKATVPAAATYVRELEFQPLPGPGQTYTPAYFHGHMDQFSLFRNVKHVRIMDLDLPAFQLHEIRRCFGHLIGSLRSLRLDYLTSPSRYTDLLRFICAFPNVDDLIIGSLHSLSQDEEDVINPEISPSFHGHLRLINFDEQPDTFPRKLTELPNGVHFRSLEIPFGNYSEGFRPFTCLLSSCESTLETLNLDMKFYDLDNMPLEMIVGFNLKRNIKFRHLILQIEASDELPLFWIKDLLSSITSSYFCDITIYAKFSLLAELNEQLLKDQWEQIDELVASINHGRVEKFTFNLHKSIYSVAEWDEAVEWIEELMPRMKERSALRFVEVLDDRH